MRLLTAASIALLLTAVLALADAETTPACPDPAAALGVARIVEIDASSGPIYGDMTRRSKEASFLLPKEVVLTFDDGPVPSITTSILDTLDSFCTKATFFSVGEMALAYPHTVKEVLARGHTLGTHTWSHPMNLPRLSLEKAKDQIERGFAAVTLAAGRPVAPFFRFPGLSDSDTLLAHLQTRGIASFTVDVVSNDSYIGSPSRLAQHALKEIESRQGGILLLHDIKAATAKALPTILSELKARGYRIVHMRPKAPVAPLAKYDTELEAILAKAPASASGRPPVLPVYGAVGPPKSLSGEPIAVVELVPEPRQRAAAASETAAPPVVSARPPKPHTAGVRSQVRRASARLKRARPETVAPGPFGL